MTLDVVVPTYKRSALLLRTLTSLMEAPVPAGMKVTVIVVDNNSQDDTAEAVAGVCVPADRILRYVVELRQGSSQARNAGIRSGSGELIGFIDDDEEIGREWYKVVYREFLETTCEFIGGPYLAQGTVKLPLWMPQGYNGILGIIPPKPRALFGPDFPGNLSGGNSVIRRSVFDQVGLYDVKLGRSGKGLLSEEDADLYRRLQDANIRGYNVPDLVIFHHIPEARMTRRYFRRWSYWRGVSHGIADKQRPEKVVYSFGIPRYRIGQGLRGIISVPGNLSETKGSGDSFARELPLWDLAGFVYGKWFVRIEKMYGSSTD